VSEISNLAPIIEGDHSTDDEQLEIPPSHPHSDPSLDGVTVWKVAPGEQGEYWESCRTGGYIGINWAEFGDLTSVERAAFERLRDQLAAQHGWKTQGVEQVWAFAKKIQVGDIVLANQGKSQILGLGRIVRTYYFQPGAVDGHRVGVDWYDLTPRVLATRENYWQWTVVKIEADQFKSLLAASHPVEFVETSSQVQDNIRRYATDPNRAAVDIKEYFVYDTVSGWVAPCKFAAYQDMTVNLYLELKRLKPSRFKGNRAWTAIEKVTDSRSTVDREACPSGHEALRALVERKPKHDKRFLYSVGPEPSREPVLSRFIAELRDEKVMRRGNFETGQRSLYKPTMLLAAMVAAARELPTTWANLRSLFTELYSLLGLGPGKPEEPYPRLRNKPQSKAENSAIAQTEIVAHVHGKHLMSRLRYHAIRNGFAVREKRTTGTEDYKATLIHQGAGDIDALQSLFPMEIISTTKSITSLPLKFQHPQPVDKIDWVSTSVEPDGPFWDIIDDATGEPAVVKDDVASAQEGTSIHWTGHRGECVEDARLRPLLIQALLEQYFTLEQRNALGEGFPELRGIAASRNFWVLQGSQQFFDVTSAVRDLDEMTWRFPHHQDRVNVGDSAFVWRCGSAGALLAVATVTTKPSKMTDDPASASYVVRVKPSGRECRPVAGDPKPKWSFKFKREDLWQRLAEFGVEPGHPGVTFRSVGDGNPRDAQTQALISLSMTKIGLDELLELPNAWQETVDEVAVPLYWFTGPAYPGGPEPAFVQTSSLPAEPFRATKGQDRNEVVTESSPPGDLEDSEFSGERPRVWIKIKKRLDPPIPRETLQAHPVLSQTRVFTQAMGSNFLLTPEEGEALLSLIEGRAQDSRPTLASLARELFLPLDFLQKIERLLQDKRQVIFYGPPGTGKTYVARKLAEYFASTTAGQVERVQFHPSYSYEDFIQGYRPRNVNGQTVFKLVNGPLMRLAKKAAAHPGSRNVLLIDELNRGNIAKIFGELYFLLEYRDEEMRLQYGARPFKLPKDEFWIIGTMNTADRSIALVDAALRRRFHFVPFFPDVEPIKGLLGRWLRANCSEMAWVAGLVEQVNGMLDNRHLSIGPSHFLRRDLDREKLEMVWEHSVIPYLQEQFFGQEERLVQFELSRLMRASNPVAEELELEASLAVSEED